MKSLSLTVVLIVLALILLFAGCSTYNSMVNAEENVEQAWSNVQNVYQRRADLIPNLVNTVKGAAANEKEILIQVTQARGGITEIKDQIGNATSPSQLDAIGGQLNRAINVVFERYPEIRSTDNFSTLQAQLEGTENRITVERQRYNEAATEYNKQIRRFPASIFAGMFGFDRRDQFEASAAAQEVPKVEF